MSVIYSAIIIDNKKLIRKGSVGYIDWQSLGVDVCATCDEGIGGIQAVLEHNPHIILSDIAIPNLDGIMLMEQVRSHGITSEVIFISSYSNFNYAHKAVKLGAFDYLLKPCIGGILQIVHESYATNLSIRQIAHQLSISNSHLSAVFKEDTGYAFGNYLYHYRMNKAQ